MTNTSILAFLVAKYDNIKDADCYTQASMLCKQFFIFVLLSL